ncbi:MAG: sensor histidine kinase [Actinocrinis sp.]
MRFLTAGRVSQLAAKAVVLCAYCLYAFMLSWTVSVKQGPAYDGPHRLPELGPAAVLTLCAVLACPVLFVRRRTIFVIGAILAESVLASEFGARSWVVLLALVVLVGYLADRGPVAAAAVALATVATSVVENTVLYPVDKSVSLAQQTAQLALWLAIAWVLGYALRKRREYTAALREQSAARALMAERLRIARELHDSVAHRIGIIAVLAGAASRVFDSQPAQARQALDGIETTSRETLTGLQRMLSALRRAEPDDASPQSAALKPADGLADLDRLAARAGASGVRVEVTWRGERRPLPPEVDLSAFRIIQEAVTNVVRHSGTRACRVGVGFEPGEVSIEILDDGRGPAHPRTAGAAGGFGLLGMRERVALLSGQFYAGPRPEGGFRVAVRLPA